MARKMRDSSQSAARRRQGQWGNAITEFALVCPFLFGFLFGIIDASVFAFRKSTAQHAVREGVRYAVTSRTMNGLGHEASIRTVVVQSSMGLVSNIDDSHLSVTFFDPVTLNAVTGVGSNGPGNIVQVALNGLPFSWIVPYNRAGGLYSISVSSSDIMEAAPDGIVPSR